MATLVERVIAREALGGASVIATALGRKWLERRLRKATDRRLVRRRRRLPAYQDVVSVERQPLVAAFYGQLIADRAGKELSLDFVPYSAHLAMLDYVGACLREAEFPDDHRLRGRIRDPHDAIPVTLEAITAAAYKRAGFEIEHRAKGPEFIVRAPQTVSVECKSKLTVPAELQDERFAAQLMDDLIEWLFARRESLHVEVEVTAEPDPGDLTALRTRIATMLQLGIRRSTACDGRFEVTVQPLPPVIDELPTPSKDRGLHTAVWRGGESSNPGPLTRPISVVVIPPDRTAVRVKGIERALNAARQNLPTSGPSVLYIGLPMQSRERAHEFARVAMPVIRRELRQRYRRMNAVVLVAMSRQDIDIANSGLFVDAWTTVQEQPRTPLPAGFEPVGREALQSQQGALYREYATVVGEEYGTMEGAEARKLGIYVPTSEALSV